MLDQLTVFLTNSRGRLTALCDALGNAGINMHALTVADTAEYGIARIICDDPKKAAEILSQENFTATVTKVVAVVIPDEPGSLARVFEAIESVDANVEYTYCFSLKGTDGAQAAIKVSETAVPAIEAAGFKTLSMADIA